MAQKGQDRYVIARVWIKGTNRQVTYKIVKAGKKAEEYAKEMMARGYDVTFH